MTEPTRNQLLGYLLGALEEDEQTLVEQELQGNARLRRELALLSKALAPLDATWHDYPPPPNLAADTCRFVETQLLRPATTSPDPEHEAAAIGRMHAVTAPCGCGDTCRLQDMAMVAGILLAASLLILPAIHSGRVQSRLLACQDNLRQIGLGLTQYSEQNQGYFPKPPTDGSTAVALGVPRTLAETQCLSDPKVILCPGSQLAANDPFTVPEVADESPRNQPRQGTYGFTLGHQRNGVLYPTRNLRRPNFPVASDAPSPWLPHHQSENHGRFGQNVLFEDGAVRFLTRPGRTTGPTTSSSTTPARSRPAYTRTTR